CARVHCSGGVCHGTTDGWRYYFGLDSW
nr:immunoglobulin heavy chain junction region [Macaca mulatta]MOW23948.1 immunoglobulin heavy chain junction region [Macaca mulatta]MOW25211.1 immunoglobulin heavy chain junction region [Macaca mulatta]MOW25408.1 immunoglobulin heavy chain junction region [Macaca mulatta]MOW25441.1 immunoglobulin heavy chain junction region [Macaca mulatta]